MTEEGGGGRQRKEKVAEVKKERGKKKRKRLPGKKNRESFRNFVNLLYNEALYEKEKKTANKSIVQKFPKRK